MGEYLRWAAAVLIGVLLAPVIGKQAKDMSLLLTVGVCVMVSLAAMRFLQPVTEFLRELRQLGELDSETVSIALKCTGVGLFSELIVLICEDAGERAMGRAVQILSSAAILWLSLPLLRGILTLLEGVLS